MKTVKGLKAFAVCSCLLLAACGGTTSAPTGTASANVSEAQSLAKKAVAPISNWQPAGQPFDASKAKGKSMFYISVSLSIPFEQYMLQGMKEGAAIVGATAVGFDAKSSVAEATRGVGEAIQAKAGVIFIDGFPPTLLAPAIAQAKAAGIPVLTANSQEAGP